MTLKRRLLGKTGALILGLVVLAVGALGSIRSLALNQERWQRLDLDLRRLYVVGLDLSAAHDALTQAPPHEAAAQTRLTSAQGRLAQYLAELPSAGVEPDYRAAQDASAQAARRVLRQPATPASLDLALNHVTALTQRTVSQVRRLQDQGRSQLHATLLGVGLLAGGLLLAAGWVAWSLYRSVMRPLRQMERGVQALAGGCFDQRLPVTGDREFVALATEFNRMAGELDGLYRNLETQVAQKSRELAQAERLAGVGYLAAGVAHEINNPLSIIAGHVELTQRALERAGAAPLDAPDMQSLRQTLTVILEETYRCKQITTNLLTLARPAADVRQTVNLPALILATLDALRATPKVGPRKLVFTAPPDPQAWTVLGSDLELRQVLLNLLVNACEATPPDGGEIRIELTREGANLALSVSDNGRGMSAATCARAFEPFYTEKRGTQPETRGTGLGLAIAAAIAREHGGSLTAHSDGPGRGSRFVLRLPALGYAPPLQN